MKPNPGKLALLSQLPKLLPNTCQQITPPGCPHVVQTTKALCWHAHRTLDKRPKMPGPVVAPALVCNPQQTGRGRRAQVTILPYSGGCRPGLAHHLLLSSPLCPGQPGCCAEQDPRTQERPPHQPAERIRGLRLADHRSWKKRPV